MPFWENSYEVVLLLLLLLTAKFTSVKFEKVSSEGIDMTRLRNEGGTYH